MSKGYTGKKKRKRNTAAFWLPKAAGAAALIVLLAAAFFGIRKRIRTKAEEAALTALEEQSRPERENRTAAGSDPVPVPCDIPEISFLIKEYFDFRLTADTAGLNRLFGRSSSPGDREYEKELKAQASWIQGVQDIEIYLLPGTCEQERIALVTYVIDFRRTDTLAPGILYAYLARDEAGTYHIVENLSKERVDHLNRMLALPDVREMMVKTDEELKAALDSNGTLALIYTSFINGEIYKETNVEIDREQEIGLILNESETTGGEAEEKDGP